MVDSEVAQSLWWLLVSVPWRILLDPALWLETLRFGEKMEKKIKIGGIASRLQIGLN